MSALAALWACALAAQSPPAAPVAVKSVRYWSLGQVTRVAIELSGEGRFRTERLEGPDRFFVDILDSRMEVGDRRPQTIKVNDLLVRQIRFAGSEGKTRVVLDLTRRLEAEVSQLANPNRIMIEVRMSADAAAPAAPVMAAPVTATPATAAPATAERSRPTEESPEKAKAAQPVAERAAQAKPAAAPDAEAVQAATPAAAAAEGVPLASAPKPAKPRAGGQQSLVRALGLKLGRVVIDAGHGGHDHGTTGPTGLTEKELVLEVALKLGALIEEKLGSEVVYTRTTDIFIPLEERTAIANQHKADLFISVHANSSPYKKASGAEVYYLNFTTSKEALDVAARENAGHGKSIFELRDLIQKIALKDKVDESREFAARLQSNLHVAWIKLNAAARNRGVKKAPFIVLIGASMPSVLTEVGFLSNPKDEQALRKPETRLKLAEALFQGVQQYAATLSEMRVARVAGETGESR